jgi:hypothetical protein
LTFPCAIPMFSVDFAFAFNGEKLHV